MGTPHHCSIAFPVFRDELRPATSDPFLWLQFFFFLAYSCHLWIGLGPGAIWMGIALRLTTIHAFLLYKKVNFRAAVSRWLSQTAETQTKVTCVTGWVTAPMGQTMTWPQMNVLADSVSHLFKCPKLSLCKHYTPRIERPLVTWVSLSKPCLTHSLCSLHGINIRWSWLVFILWGKPLCIRQWALLNFLLYEFSINVFFCFSPGEVTAQK